MTVIRGKRKEKKEKTHQNIYRVIAKENEGVTASFLVDFICADSFEVEGDGESAFFYFWEESSLEKELVCVMRGWREIKLMDPTEIKDILERRRLEAKVPGHSECKSAAIPD